MAALASLACVATGCALDGGASVDGAVGGGVPDGPMRVEDIRLDPERFEMLEPARIDLARARTPDEVAAALERRFSPAEPTEGAFEDRTHLLTDPGGGVTAIYTATGLADDAVRAEQIVLEAEPRPGGGYAVRALGRRWRCWRGDVDPRAWTTHRCP